MKIQYTLTMLNKWSRDGELFAVIKDYTPKVVEKLLQGKNTRSWHYRWSDGWAACITAQPISGKEITRVRKESQGFCGYDWMIHSIELHDEIRA